MALHFELLYIDLTNPVGAKWLNGEQYNNDTTYRVLFKKVLIWCVANLMNNMFIPN